MEQKVLQSFIEFQNPTFLSPPQLQAGFAAEGAETGTRFLEVNLLEKVCFVRFLHVYF